MGDLAADTDLVATGPGAYERTLSADWEIWGPNGGYVAAVALRAAELHTGRARPANASVHFLGVADFERPVTVTVRDQRVARRASSVAVEVVQAGRPILAGMIWAVDDDLAGLEHDDAPAPDVVRWSDLPTLAERLAAEGLEGGNSHSFWDNFDARPPVWVADWANREPDRPLYQNWLRYLEGGSTDDPWRQAARLLVLVDLGGWPSVGRRHVGDEWVAPSIDVACEFHRVTTGDEWLLLQAESPHAGDGLIASHQQVWNDRGELLASGISHLLCRRIR
jgi:acyl-CoA thioesterase